MISITDGQIFLETDLFNSVIRPAINPGISVSRVGGAAQRKVIKKLVGSIRIAHAQYRELAAFAQFASDLDETTRAQLAHGQIVTEIMKQKQYMPLSVAEIAIVLYAVNNGYYKSITLNKALDFEAGFLSFIKSNSANVIENINTGGEMSKDDEKAIKKSLDEFKTIFGA